MRFALTPQQERFRQEIRDFLAAELPPEDHSSVAEPEDARVNIGFSKKLAAKGWIGLAWPVEFGGRGLGPIERFIYNEEMVYHRAPLGYHQFAERQMGPSIILNGTDYQKQAYLPRIAAADIGFCIGYTEPNAGSDLANVQTAAIPDGDDYIISGEKLYTSNAHCSTHIWLAARITTGLPKHRGVSVFIVPLDSPGVTIQPIWTMAGSRLNMVTFDHVRVPAREMVGGKDQGWYVVAQNLDFERSGIERIMAGLLLFEELVHYAKETRRSGRALFDDPVLRGRIADIATGYRVGRLLAFRVAWLQSRGTVANAEASMSKAFGADLSQKTAQLGMQVLGMYGPVQDSDQWAPLRSRVAYNYLLTVSDSIRAGTSEIQRNIIATRGLGLPRTA